VPPEQKRECHGEVKEHPSVEERLKRRKIVKVNYWG